MLAVTADITREAEVLSAIEQTISAYDRIDILVNNAGVLNDPTPFHLMTDRSMDGINQYKSHWNL